MTRKWLGLGGVGVLVLAVGLAPAWGEVTGVGHAGGPGGIPNGGRGTQGYLGIDVRDVSEENIGTLKLRDAHGAEIIRVDHDGPAGKMGLREHDVVLQMNGVVVEGEEPIRRMLRDTAPGKAVVLVISRDGRQLTVSGQMADQGEVDREAWERHLATPGPQAPATGLPSGEAGAMQAPNGNPVPVPQSRYGKSFLGTFLPNPTYTGVLLEVMGPQLAQFFAVPGGSGLLVHSVDVNSPAAMAGIRAGDIVTKANFQPLTTPGKWTKIVRESKGRPVTVTVVRDRQERTFTVVPDSKKRAGPKAQMTGVATDGGLDVARL